MPSRNASTPGARGPGRSTPAAITAFTVAHSITLAAATLGFVRVPGAPVEAIIALSIVFLAVEVQQGQGQNAPNCPLLSIRRHFASLLRHGLSVLTGEELTLRLAL